MKISSFKRMRVYRANGRIAIILRVALPRAESEGEAERAICTFYKELSEAYFKGAEKLLATVRESDGEPISVSVDYSLRREYPADKVIAIDRTFRLNGRGVSEKSEHVDLFCAQSGRFLREKNKKGKEKRKPRTSSAR